MFILHRHVLVHNRSFLFDLPNNNKGLSEYQNLIIIDFTELDTIRFDANQNLSL